MPLLTVVASLQDSSRDAHLFVFKPLCGPLPQRIEPTCGTARVLQKWWCVASALFSPRSPAVGEAHCHVVKVRKLPCGEPHRVRNSGLLPTAMWVSRLGSGSSSPSWAQPHEGPWARSTLLSCSWMPDPQKPEDDRCLWLQLLEWRIISYLEIYKYYAVRAISSLLQNSKVKMNALIVKWTLL